MISFTGSTAVGRSIGQICGQMLKKVALELGGHNAIIVLDDADVDAATSGGAWGSFHQGQICMQTGRHLVHRSVANQYVSRLAERARKLVVGNPRSNPVHLGPLINQKQLDRIDSIVKQSAAGARLVGGKL
ncbi:aldehyde dehydrogenase family protein [Cupriavidus sp. DF5525]|uniref:aldehyde dehydrogenase family protein n=1 Tax=Cupriavidus sp. DF5525 TaxID=3160989 RepID=UPI0032DF3A36